MKSGFRLLRRSGALAAVAAAVLLPVLNTSVARVDAVALVSTTPADGSSVPTPPAQLAVTFDGAINPDALMAVTCNGSAANGITTRVSGDQLTLIGDVTTPLPKGQCSVFWRVQGTADPSTTTATFTFKIEQDAATAPSVDPTATTTDTASGTASSSNLSGPLGLFRLISTIALAALFGGLVLITVAWPEGVEYILTIRFLRYAWLIGVIATALTVACFVGQHTGKGFTASMLPTNWGSLTDTHPGLALLARMVLIVASGWVAMRPERVIDPATQLPALALPGLAVATLGFSRSGGDLELVGYAAGAAHAIAMAVWVGGLVLLARVVLAGPGEDDLVHAVRGFGRISTPAMLVTVVTGAIQLYRLDRGHLLDTTHGRLLLLKVVPVVAMVFVGVATRQFVHARLARAESMSAPLAGRLRRAVGMEAIIGVVVLGITSWMLSTQPGNLLADARSSNDFALQQRFRDTDGKLEAKVSINPGRVGANEVLIEVSKPTTGISSLTVQFDPPVNSTANPVLMTITQFPAGVTGWYLPLDVGIPLGASGAWQVTLNIVSTDGTFTEGAIFNVLPTGDVTTEPITTVVQPPVTSPPISADPNAVTTTVAG
jgi:copper transport protein